MKIEVKQIWYRYEVISRDGIKGRGRPRAPPPWNSFLPYMCKFVLPIHVFGPPWKNPVSAPVYIN